MGRCPFRRGRPRLQKPEELFFRFFILKLKIIRELRNILNLKTRAKLSFRVSRTILSPTYFRHWPQIKPQQMRKFERTDRNSADCNRNYI